MIQFQSSYKARPCEVSLHSDHEMSGNVYDILFCIFSVPRKPTNYIYYTDVLTPKGVLNVVYTSLPANKRKQLPRCCRPSTACFLVKPVLPCSGWRPSLRVRTSLTRCVFNDVERVITIEWRLRMTMCPRSFHFHGFQATPLHVSGKRNAGIYLALLVVLAYISKVDLKAIHSGRTCREVFPLWQLGWRIEIWPKKAILTTGQ